MGCGDIRATWVAAEDSCYFQQLGTYRPVDMDLAQTLHLDVTFAMQAWSNATFLEFFLAKGWDLDLHLNNRASEDSQKWLAWVTFLKTLSASLRQAHAMVPLAFLFLHSIREVQGHPDVFNVTFWKVYATGAYKLKNPSYTGILDGPGAWDLGLYQASIRESFAEPGVILTKTLQATPTPSPTPAYTPSPSPAPFTSPTPNNTSTAAKMGYFWPLTCVCGLLTILCIFN